MGYSMDKLIEIITEHEERKFYSGSQWKSGELRMDQEKINAQQKREEFRAKLAEAGYESHTVYSSKVLEAYDLVHCPELRNPILKALQSLMTETEVRMGRDAGSEHSGWITQYGAGCIVDGLRNQGYEIIKIIENPKMDVGVTTINGRNVVCDIGQLIDVVRLAGFKVEPNQK